MDTTIEVYEDVAVCKLSGRLDATSVFDLDERFQVLVEKEIYKFVINMQHLSYLSSAGIRLLLSLNTKLSSFSGSICLCEATGQVADVLRISGFDKALTICEHEQECYGRFI
ncbi:MAG: STAS domain-containing protein [Victivallaceae bacterium]